MVFRKMYDYYIRITLYWFDGLSLSRSLSHSISISNSSPSLDRSPRTWSETDIKLIQNLIGKKFKSTARENILLMSQGSNQYLAISMNFHLKLANYTYVWHTYYNMSMPTRGYSGQQCYTTSFICVIIAHRILLVGRCRGEITTAKCKVLTYSAMSPAPHKYDKQTAEYTNIHVKRRAKAKNLFGELFAYIMK